MYTVFLYQLSTGLGSYGYMYSSTSPSPALMYIYITASDANGIILATGRSDQHLSLRGPGLDDAFEGLGVSMHDSPRRLVA